MTFFRHFVWFGFAMALGGAEHRINHAGRILGPQPVVAAPILFHTPEADAVVAALQIMPKDSPWNEDVSQRPVLANSAAMMAQIRADLSASRRTLRAFFEMNYVLVPESQPLVPIVFTEYPDESDPGPYPIPANLPIETWPRETGSLSLPDWQRDVQGTGGDRHAIIVAPQSGQLWEMWQARLTGNAWQASNGARFSLQSNALRPLGWTSADAAGLPMFPALVRYDECLRGQVEHAMRIVVRRTRRASVYPATHYAASTPASEVNVPAMGQRLRLKSSFVIPEHWTIYEKAVLRGLKTYGALVADNGNFFSISVTPDPRYPANAFTNLATIDVDVFEVVQSTGPSEGPRSAGAPTVDAGPERHAQAGVPMMLAGQVTGDGVEISWRKYSGPGDVVFGNPQQPTTAATFSVAGHYTLLLRAADGAHTPAYDAVDVIVSAGGTPTLNGRLSNLSTRSLVGNDQQTQIAGFVIAGSAPKRVLLRAAGPALGDLGVKGALQDPVLRLLSGREVVAENDDWSTALMPDFVAAGAAAWAPGSADAALVATLPPGNYSAQVTGADTHEGIGLVEVFELPTSDPTSTLVNLSTRSLTRVGDGVQIAGFVISGGSRRVLIRASGPALSKLGINDAVRDPELVVYHGAAEIARNDNWDAATIAVHAQAAGAFQWTTGSRDAAVVLTLAPGNYSAHVRAVDGAGGVALVEVYALP